MSSRFQRSASIALFCIAACAGVSARAQPAASPSTAQMQSAAASAPAQQKKRTAKTPPGKPPRGAAPCNQSDKAQRQRCLRDLYGPGAPPA